MCTRVLFVIVAVLALGTGYSGFPRLPLFGKVPSLRLVAVPAPAERVNDRLTWLAGMRIESDDPLVGGFSALAVRGRRFTLLNDGGNYAAFTLSAHDRVGDVRFGELPAGPGTGWEKRDRDSESLTVAPDGTFWVGYERANAIWRYTPDFAAATATGQPPLMRHWRENSGAEAMVRLRDGRFVVFSEGSRWGGPAARPAVVFAGDPATAPTRAFGFTYVTAPGFAVVDATQLPDGDIVVLERRWLLPLRFRSRLALVRRAALRPGAVVRGSELGRIVPPWPTENYEGIAATREGAATVLWLVSDNDQMGHRASYLLKLRLD